MKKFTIVFTLLMSLGLEQAHAAEVKVASVSLHSKDQSYNIPKMSEISATAAKNGAKLVVFPEMSSTGFLYSSLNEAKPNLDMFPGKATAAFGKVAQ